MSKTNKQNHARKRKRKPPVNRHNRAASQSNNDLETELCASEKKIKLDHYKDLAINAEDDNFFLLLNFSILKEMFTPLLSCPVCQYHVTLTDIQGHRMGFCHNLEIRCLSCEWKKSFYSSKECSTGRKTQGRKMYEINARAVIGFREIGHGLSAMQTLSKCMNLSSECQSIQ